MNRLMLMCLYLPTCPDPQSIDELVQDLPAGAQGLANIAGLPPTAPAELVMRVNLYGLIRLTGKPRSKTCGRRFNRKSGVAGGDRLVSAP